MSIATLKKKTAAKYNNSSVNVPNFSINGGYRNQGWVGQTSLSRSLPRTPMVGNTPRGSGGCCGTYNLTPIVQSGVTSIDDNSVIKSSVISNNGMIDENAVVDAIETVLPSVLFPDNQNAGTIWGYQADVINGLLHHLEIQSDDSDVIELFPKLIPCMDEIRNPNSD